MRVGQPNGQSIPVLPARSTAWSMTLSSAGRATSSTTERPAVHLIMATAVRSGYAARSTPTVITGKGYCGRSLETDLFSCRIMFRSHERRGEQVLAAVSGHDDLHRTGLRTFRSPGAVH